MKKTRKLTRFVALVMACAMVLACVAGAADTSTTSRKAMPQNQWYTQYVQWALDQGYLDNLPDWEFAPDAPMNRAQFLIVMASVVNGKGRNTDGVFGMEDRSVFTDIRASDYYSPAVYWGYDNGIIDGTSETTFSPMDPVTREQVATILGRAIVALDIKLEEAADAVPSFADQNKISDWAAEAAELMRKYGIIQGDERNCFDPKKNMTQAEALTMLYRVLTRNQNTLHVHRWLEGDNIHGYMNFYCLDFDNCNEHVFLRLPDQPVHPYDPNDLDSVFHDWVLYDGQPATSISSGTFTYRCVECMGIKTETITPLPANHVCHYELVDSRDTLMSSEAGKYKRGFATYACSCGKTFHLTRQYDRSNNTLEQAPNVYNGELNYCIRTATDYVESLGVVAVQGNHPDEVLPDESYASLLDKETGSYIALDNQTVVLEGRLCDAGNGFEQAVQAGHAILKAQVDKLVAAYRAKGYANDQLVISVWCDEDQSVIKCMPMKNYERLDNFDKYLSTPEALWYWFPDAE